MAFFPFSYNLHYLKFSIFCICISLSLYSSILFPYINVLSFIPLVLQDTSVVLYPMPFFNGREMVGSMVLYGFWEWWGLHHATVVRQDRGFRLLTRRTTPHNRLLQQGLLRIYSDPDSCGGIWWWNAYPNSQLHFQQGGPCVLYLLYSEICHKMIFFSQ